MSPTNNTQFDGASRSPFFRVALGVPVSDACPHRAARVRLRALTSVPRVAGPFGPGDRRARSDGPIRTWRVPFGPGEWRSPFFRVALGVPVSSTRSVKVCTLIHRSGPPRAAGIADWKWLSHRGGRLGDCVVWAAGLAWLAGAGVCVDWAAGVVRGLGHRSLRGRSFLRLVRPASLVCALQ